MFRASALVRPWMRRSPSPPSSFVACGVRGVEYPGAIGGGWIERYLLGSGFSGEGTSPTVDGDHSGSGGSCPDGGVDAACAKAGAAFHVPSATGSCSNGAAAAVGSTTPLVVVVLHPKVPGSRSKADSEGVGSG